MDGIEMGSFSSKNEGYFDPWSFVMAMKSKVSLIATEGKKEGENKGGKNEGGMEGGRKRWGEETKEGERGGNIGVRKGGINRVRSCISIICIYSECSYCMILNHITSRLLCTKIFYFIPIANVYLIII